MMVHGIAQQSGQLKGKSFQINVLGNMLWTFTIKAPQLLLTCCCFSIC